MNSVQYLRYFENARISYAYEVLKKLSTKEYEDFIFAPKRGTIGPILMKVACKYINPVFYPDTLLLGTKIEAEKYGLITTSRAISVSSGILVAECVAFTATYDYAKKEKALLPESINALIQKQNFVELNPQQ